MMQAYTQAAEAALASAGFMLTASGAAAAQPHQASMDVADTDAYKVALICTYTRELYVGRIGRRRYRCLQGGVCVCVCVCVHGGACVSQARNV